MSPITNSAVRLRLILGAALILAVVSVASQANAQTSSSTGSAYTTTSASATGSGSSSGANTASASRSSYYQVASSGTMPNGGIPNYAAFPILAVSSTGPEVYDIQSLLIELGYLRIPHPTGYFGNLTKSALSALQSALGIASNGYFDLNTKSAVASRVQGIVSGTLAFRNGSFVASSGSASSGNTSSNIAYNTSGSVSTDGNSISTSMLAPLHPTGYWLNGNWYSSVPAAGTPNVMGYWLNGTWMPLSNTSQSIASNTAGGTNGYWYNGVWYPTNTTNVGGNSSSDMTASSTSSVSSSGTYGMSRSLWDPSQATAAVQHTPGTCGYTVASTGQATYTCW